MHVLLLIRCGLTSLINGLRVNRALVRLFHLQKFCAWLKVPFVWPGPEVIKLFSTDHEIFPAQKCSNANNGLHFNMNERKNSILGLSEPTKSWITWYFYTYERLKFHAQMSWTWKKFFDLGA